MLNKNNPLRKSMGSKGLNPLKKITGYKKINALGGL
jgi:hypothetical protein